eukprot:GSChrysophyteH1.ASY1.ANO1.1646.1 assembled CDS
MPLSLNFEANGDKAQLVAGLATLLAADCGEITADAIDGAVSASGNTLPAGFSSMYAAFASKMDKDQLTPTLGGGGGADGGAAADAGAAEEAAPAAPAEEEVDALDGGMDMFGGGGGGGDY